MILHIGGDEIILTRHIIAILDIQSSNSVDTRAFLEACQDRCRQVRVSNDEVKTIIVALTPEGKPPKEEACRFMLYHSPISSLTLLKRSGFAGQQKLEGQSL